MSTEMLTVRELAKRLKMNPKSIYNGISRNAKHPFPIKPTRVGRKVLFSPERVEAFINGEG